MKKTPANPPSLTFLSLIVCLIPAPGCDVRTVGVTGDAHVEPDGCCGPERDGTVGRDGQVRPDAGTAGLYGRIVLYHHDDISEYGGQWLNLSAAFYTEPYEPPEVQGFELVDTRVTPNSGPCDIYFRSGMDPDPPPPPPPDPPPQDNGGVISAGPGTNTDDVLTVRFEGGQYTTDHRGGPDNPLPGWLSPVTQTVFFDGEGSPTVSPFTNHVDLPGPPVITAPNTQGDPIDPDQNGHYVISWEIQGADETAVYINSNMDWDDSVIACHPTPGTNRLQIPMMWIMDWTWGYSEVMVAFRNKLSFYVPDAGIVIQTQGSTQFFAHFQIWYP